MILSFICNEVSRQCATSFFMWAYPKPFFTFMRKLFMTQIPQILLHQLSYRLPNNHVLFEQLSAAFSLHKTGLIGRNGLGKSTLFKLICGELRPWSGNIEVQGHIANVAQQVAFKKQDTIADVLEVNDKVAALLRIQAGSVAEEDYALLNDDWQVMSRCERQLQLFELDYLNLDTPLINLSGGELTRLLLCKAFNSNADFILLDEPTNHLDIHARKILYNHIANWNRGLIVISHDRELLNLMDDIYELTTLGLNVYGGNYDHYETQARLMEEARQRTLQDAKKLLQNAKASVQGSKEKHEQKQAKGRNLRKSGSIDKLTANAKLGKSQRSQAKMAIKEERLLTQATTNLETIKEKIEIIDEINIQLPQTEVANGKIILDIEHLNFAYPNAEPLIKNLNLQLQGPNRIALVGGNGSGKTTLLHLILGKLQTTSGSIFVGTERVCYLDQQVNVLQPDLTLLDNFLLLNNTATEQEAYAALASFLFKNQQAKKIVQTLSGGEKIRAMLACVLLAKTPPHLLILDEPSNHLDLITLRHLEMALGAFRGAMLVVSHDLTFLKNIGINHYISF